MLDKSLGFEDEVRVKDITRTSMNTVRLRRTTELPGGILKSRVFSPLGA